MPEQDILDDLLVLLYRKWSAEEYCATWMICDDGSESQFITWLLAWSVGPDEAYQREDVPLLRKALIKRMAEGIYA